MFLAETKLKFPENITELYLQNNSLSNLPLQEITKAKNLKILDVRNNDLTNFDVNLVKKIKDENLEVYFEGEFLEKLYICVFYVVRS